jgi:Fic family protein
VRVRGRLIHKTWEGDPALYAPARYRRPCSYDAFVPEPLASYSPKIGAQVAGVISDAEARIAELNAVARPALAPLARLLLRTESIASSKVEGMQVDGRTLARAEARSDTGERVGPEALEVLANIDAMQLAVEEASAGAVLGVEHILAVHRVLLERAPNAQVAGELRGDQNWIGGNDYTPCGADFVPPPPENVAALLDDLVAFCADETLPPIVQAGVAHAQFETIHPFADGNGRTGRALIQVILRRRGLAPAYVPPISVVLATTRDRYIQGLGAFREGRDDEWLTLFATSAARAAELAARYLGKVELLQERWREQIRAAGSRRADAAAWVVIDVLPAYPVISVPVAVGATRRTRPAVANAIDQLAEAGVLVPLSETRRNRSWEAAGLLDLLEGLESGRQR